MWGSRIGGDRQTRTSRRRRCDAPLGHERATTCARTTTFWIPGAVNVAQLAEWSLPTPEISSSSLVISTFYLKSTVLKLFWKDKNKWRRGRWWRKFKKIFLIKWRLNSKRTLLNNRPLQPKRLLLGSTMLIEPHSSRQHAVVGTYYY